MGTAALSREWSAYFNAHPVLCEQFNLLNPAVRDALQGWIKKVGGRGLSWA